MDRDEIVRMFEEGFEAFAEGDFDRAVEPFSEDFVLVRPGEGGEVRGRDAVRAFYEPDALVDMRFELDSIEVYGDIVVICGRVSATGRASGIPVSQETVQAWWMRGAQVTRVENHLDRAAAFAAAGIEDPKVSA